jgi:hypothetical protein
LKPEAEEREGFLLKGSGVGELVERRQAGIAGLNSIDGQGSEI